MATTRIMPMHIVKGETLGSCLGDRIDYGLNPQKTNNFELITAHACDYQTAVSEFLLSKRRYKQLTGREECNEVIAYQVRQSFRPGEVTAEEAHQIGCELAERFLKGNHAFIVCTHTDTKHIHNHIYWNSTTLDCRKKFRDFLGSGRALGRLSDLICIEHELSTIANPQRGSTKYHRWLGNKATPSHRELLRVAIDNALAQKPKSFDDFLQFLESDGYTVNHGTDISFMRSTYKYKIRMRSLGEGYSEAEIRAVIEGLREHTPKKRSILTACRTSCLPFVTSTRGKSPRIFPTQPIIFRTISIYSHPKRAFTYPKFTRCLKKSWIRLLKRASKWKWNAAS